MDAIFHIWNSHFPAPETTETPAAYPEAPPARRHRILLVDDDPSIREVLTGALEDEGHITGTAVDGVEGLSRFFSDHWDIVVLDRVMPRMNGFELAAAIKEHAPDFPVLMITGVAELPPSSPTHPLPIDGLLKKPFRNRQLMDAITFALEKVGAHSGKS